MPGAGHPTRRIPRHASGVNSMASTRLIRLSSSPLAFVLLVSLTCGAARTEAQTKAYVTNTTSGTVTVIDTSTEAVLGSIAVGAGPTRVAVAADGTRAYVVNRDSDSVSAIDTATDTVVATIAVGDSPAALAIAPDGLRIYVTL